MDDKDRSLPYGKAIREALYQLLKSDDKVFMIGVGVQSPWYMGSSMTDLDKEFGADRVIDIPISENLITGLGVGAAMAGMRPVVMHPRMDFMYYAFDPIMNHAAVSRYMFGGQTKVPLTIRAVINRGGEQAAQHSQAIQAMFAHVPGIKVVMPATSYDAKGLLISAVHDENPVLYIDDRWLYGETGSVPEKMYEVPIGKANIRRRGDKLTIVSYSHATQLVAEVLDGMEESIEFIDLRTIKPFDREAIIASVRKTKKLLIIEEAWLSFGVGAEILASVAEEVQLDGCRRLGLPDCPAPASSVLEESYYLNAEKIKNAIDELMEE